MTIAESKVKEFANKLLELIERSENEDPKNALHTVKCYLCGIIDGLDFSKEMNETGDADDRTTTDDSDQKAI